MKKTTKIILALSMILTTTYAHDGFKNNRVVYGKCEPLWNKSQKLLQYSENFMKMANENIGVRAHDLYSLSYDAKKDSINTYKEFAKCEQNEKKRIEKVKAYYKNLRRRIK